MCKVRKTSISTLSLFAVFLFYLVSCSDKSTNLKGDRVIVCGHSDISGPELQTIKVKFVSVTSFNLSKIEYLEYIDKETGDFRFEFQLLNPLDILLTYNKSLTLLLSPGDSLYIHFDKDFVTCTQPEMDKHITFYGSGADLNNTVLRYRQFQSDNKFQPNVEGKSTEEYKSDLSKWIESQNMAIDRFIEQTNPSREFVKWVKSNNVYSNANYLVDYMFYSDMNHQPFPKDLFDKEIFPVNNDQAIIASMYRFHLNQYIQVKYLRDSVFLSLKDKNTVQAFETVIDLFLKKEEPGLSRDIMLCDLLAGSLYYDLSDAEKLKKTYSGKISDLTLKSEFVKMFDESMVNRSKNIGFTSLFNEVDPTAISNDLFDDLSKRFNGKVLYIVFWATWCGPCRIDLAESFKLSELYRDEPVEFIYVCVRSTKNDWDAFIKNRGLKSNHYYLDMLQSEILTDKLGIVVFPTHYLLNKKGEIVLKDAPGPSTSSIKKELAILIEG